MRRHPLSLALILAGCGTTPTIATVTPQDIRLGGTLHVHGTGFQASTSLQFTSAEAITHVLPIQLIDETHLTAKVPDTLSTGSWRLLLSNGSYESEPKPLNLWSVATDLPCQKHYALTAKASATTRQITVRRTMPDKSEQKLVFDQSVLQRLELAQQGTPEAPCFSIWLVQTDGPRVLLADDHIDLKQAATAMAEGLEIPLITVDEASK